MAGAYDAFAAQFRTGIRRWDANRRNPMKDDVLQAYVFQELRDGKSPEVIAGRLKKERGRAVISHETIYRWAYMEELTAHLPRGKPRRHRRRWRLKASKGTQGLGPVVGIQKRPKAASSRRRFGDWEGDSMLGKRKRGAIISVQQERRSRFILLSKCQDKSSHATKKAVTRCVKKMSERLRRSLTLDRGTENAEWEAFGLPVYFCDAYSSWQKGSVENVIGLLRRYLPKGMDLSTVTPKQLKSIQDKLNHRPRKILGFRTPHEVLSSYCSRLGVRIPN
jgi:IS30 family transposase